MAAGLSESVLERRQRRMKSLRFIIIIYLNATTIKRYGFVLRVYGNLYDPAACYSAKLMLAE